MESSKHFTIFLKKRMMKKIKPSDMCITSEPVPQEIMDNIVEYFVNPLNKVQEEIGIKVTISQKSGFRPYWYEKGRGRNGKSQHTFGQREKVILSNVKGAADVTCENFKENKDNLLNAMIKHCPYLRYAVYKTFIHVDMRDLKQGRKRLFSSNSKSQWTLIKYL